LKISAQQKNGIIQLAFLLGVICLLFYINNHLPIHKPEFLINTEIQAKLDLQKTAYQTKKNKNTKTYYVNSINDYIGYQLGLNTKQIDTLIRFLESGKLIYNLKEFQKIVQVDFNQLDILKNKLRFPKKRIISKPFITSKTKNKFYTKKQFNLNKVTAIQLEKELQLPTFIAKRIVKYRTYLNGYKNIEQIEKVYSILPYQIERIKNHCFVK